MTAAALRCARIVVDQSFARFAFCNHIGYELNSVLPGLKQCYIYSYLSIHAGRMSAALGGSRAKRAGGARSPVRRVESWQVSDTWLSTEAADAVASNADDARPRRDTRHSAGVSSAWGTSSTGTTTLAGGTSSMSHALGTGTGAGGGRGETPALKCGSRFIALAAPPRRSCRAVAALLFARGG